MVEGTSYMFVTGPNVVKTVTHEEVDSEYLGGATTHTTISGVAHLAAPDEATAMDHVRRLIAHLPQNNLGEAPRITSTRRTDGTTTRSRGTRTTHKGRTTCTT